MKKQTIAFSLSLLAATTGFADCCCTPCCTPQPRDPICCECYVPSWNDMQCDCGFFLTADFLYWYARECDLGYATRVVSSPEVLHSGASLNNATYFLFPVESVNLDTKWEPGVRVGLGWNTDCDGWDVYFQWTGYWNDNSSSKSVAEFTNLQPEAGGFALIPQFILGNTSQFAFEKVKGEWDFKMNRFDLQIGKRYWLSKCFTLRPYGGLGGIWTETDFDVTAFANTSVLVPADNATTMVSGKAEINNYNWGVGFVGGFQPTFQFSDCFALYADAGMALLWGELKERNSVTLSQCVDPGSSSTLEARDQTLTQNYKNDYYCMTPILDLALGLRFETYWCDQQYHFALDIGWEHHILLHHNHRSNFGQPLTSLEATTGDNFVGPATYTPLRETNVAMGGLVVKVRFDF